MRDRLLNESLTRLAAEAATHFTTLVAGGDQIPFDVAEHAGPDSHFHSYVPLTSRYVEQREDEVRQLGAFRAACEAVEVTDVATTYLEQRGEPVPADPRERSSRMLTAFLASLWDGCTEFSLDRARLDSALSLLDAQIRDADEAEYLLAPVVGLQMRVARLHLPHGMQLVRADTFEAPIEAIRSEGMGRTAWQPQFLVIAEQGEGPESAGEALRQMHELITVMRLFKAGGVGLGPYAFAPTGEGQWRRIATGAPTLRVGGYRLREEEPARLAEFAADLERRPGPAASLAWAIHRFELGCARESALDGLSDQLLALRALLDGKGPVGASLPMRAAALVDAGSDGRHAARERFEEALELERSVMRGASPESATALAAWAEEHVRRLLREAALGDLGSDLGTAADEALIAGGLSEGDAEVAVAPDDADPELSELPHMPAAEGEGMGGIDSSLPSSRPDHDLTPSGPDEGPAQTPDHHLEDQMEQETRIMEPIPGEDEIRITATNWLEEVEVAEDAGTLEWPAGSSRPEQREPIDSPTVRHLFPVPEDADWQVRELEYDHYRRRAG